MLKNLVSGKIRSLLKLTNVTAENLQFQIRNFVSTSTDVKPTQQNIGKLLASSKARVTNNTSRPVAPTQSNRQFNAFAFLFGKTQYMKQLEEVSNNHPNDVQVQLKYFHELSKMDSELAKSKLESGKYIVGLNKMAAAEVIIPKIVAEGAEKVPVGNGPILGSTNNDPIRVIMVPSPGESRYRAMNLALGFLGPVVFLLVGYMWYESNNANATDENNPFPVAPAHSMINTVKERFGDVKGIDEAKDDLVEVVEYLRNPEKFTKLGARLPKGVLLYGEPGCGKTLLARAVAGEAEVPFYYVSGSSFDEMFVGVGPRRVRDLFEEAKKNSPCIIFIDEIDAIGVSRKYSMNGGGSYAKESTLNQLLTEMDGFKQNDGIIVIGATNLPDSLDAALTRPGRFDKVVVVPTPDINGRKQIIDLYLKKTIHDLSVDSYTLARGTTGFTGAEISNLINIAAIKAAINGKSALDMHTLEEARDDIIMGGKKRTFVRTMEELQNCAFHEGGHALVALYSKHTTPVHKATIASRGQALGVTSFLPEKDNYSQTKAQMLARLRTLMGGRAAEELIYGEEEVTSGASNDLQVATQLARNMVFKLGLSEKSGLVYNDSKTLDYLSESEKQLLDGEVKRILQTSYHEAKQILKTHEKELHLLADALLKYETLSLPEIKEVIEGKPLRSPLAVGEKRLGAH